MSAKNRARPLLPLPEDSAAKTRPVLAAAPQVSKPALVPHLRLAPLSTENQPRRFARVPTHPVGVHPEHREYPPPTLNLPLRLPSSTPAPSAFPSTPLHQ